MQEIVGSTPQTRDYFCWLILHGTVLVAWRAGFARVLATRGIFGRVFAADACARDCCRFWSNFSVFSLPLPCAPTAATFLFQFSSIKRLVLLAFATL
jgi:hypothetical protein